MIWSTLKRLLRRLFSKIFPVLDDDDRVPFQQLFCPAAFQGEIGHQKGETAEQNQPEKVKTGFRIDVGGVRRRWNRR